jgi:hypothetical protein
MNITNTKHRLSRSALVWIIAFIPAVLPAQSIWLDRSWGRSISLEILKPNFKRDEQFKFASSALFVTLRLPLAESLRLSVELPFAHAVYRQYEYDYYSYRPTFHEESETAVGNPYIGLEAQSDVKTLSVEIGLRLPLASEKKYNAQWIGITSDFDREEAFARKLLPLQLSLNYHLRDASGFAVRLRGGPDFWIRTSSESEGDKTELLLHYSTQMGYEGERLSVLAGVTGRWLLSEKNLTFAERTFHQLGFEASVALGRFRPGLHIRFPLDKDLSDLFERVYGLNCSVQLD